MDRMMVYPGQVPLETDLLNTNKFAMIGLAKLASAILGTGTLLHSLPCTPGGGLNINVGAGQIYQLANLESTVYSSLPADTAHQVLKQGVLLDAVTLATPAPATAGQSINYLVQVGYQDADIGATVLQYFNSANPLQPYTGPNGTGNSSTTVRAGQCVVQVKAGAAAATGSQVTPSPDSGFTAAYVVTVANGASSVGPGNIVVASNAPFLAGLLNSHHGGVPGQAPKIDLTKEVTGVLPLANMPAGLSVWCGTSAGTANAQVLTPSSTLSAMPAGTALAWVAGFTNTGAATITVAGGFGPYPMLKDSPSGAIPLTGGEIVAGVVVTGRFDGTSFQLEDTVLGTAAMANASSATGNVAAISGGTTSGRLPVFADAAGTLQNGPAISANTGKVAAVSGTIAAGHLAVFADAQGTVQDGGLPGVAAPSTYINASTTVGAGSYLVDTSAAPITLTLQASPLTGTALEFIDATGSWSTSPLTLNGNGQTILGSSTSLICDVSGEVFKIWFNGSDWRVL